MLLRLNTVGYEEYPEFYNLKLKDVIAGKGTKKRLPHWTSVNKFLKLYLIKKPDIHQAFYE